MPTGEPADVGRVEKGPMELGSQERRDDLTVTSETAVTISAVPFDTDARRPQLPEHPHCALHHVPPVGKSFLLLLLDYQLAVRCAALHLPARAATALAFYGGTPTAFMSTTSAANYGSPSDAPPPTDEPTPFATVGVPCFEAAYGCPSQAIPHSSPELSARYGR